MWWHFSAASVGGKELERPLLKTNHEFLGPKRLLQTAPEKTWSNTEAGGWFLQAREN